MRVILVNIRDPQFYAIPAKKRGKNDRIQVMGFPPIGIMSLSSVLQAWRPRVLHVRPSRSRNPQCRLSWRRYAASTRIWSA